MFYESESDIVSKVKSYLKKMSILLYEWSFNNYSVRMRTSVVLTVAVPIFGVV